MIRYNGPIQNANDARLLIAALCKVGTTEAMSACQLLYRNWQSVAARPDTVNRMIEIARGGELIRQKGA
jgi:hypothetical protein